MRKISFRYGIYSGIALCGLSLISWFALPDLDFGLQEVLGYASMILSLLFVYFGIRHFRERENNGELSLADGLRIGLGISLIAAICFGLLDLVYVKWMNPEFMDQYYESVLDQMQSSLPAAEFEEKRQEMESQKALFSNPWMSFLVMSLTVFFIGLIISLLSSLVLRRKASAHN
jgi:hypothetical protein